MRVTTAILLAALSAAAHKAGAEVPPCLLGNCKSATNCELYGGPKTENLDVFNRICLNNVRWAEPGGSGEYDKFWERGVYKCSCCGLELYSSEHKYNSRSGWPAFYDQVNDAAVLHNPRDGEVVCSRCGAHLGHRFTDGPKQKTGIRDCINSACMHFEHNSSYPCSDPDVALSPLSGSATGGSAGEIELPIRPTPDATLGSNELQGTNTSSATDMPRLPMCPGSGSQGLRGCPPAAAILSAIAITLAVAALVS